MGVAAIGMAGSALAALPATGMQSAAPAQAAACTASDQFPSIAGWKLTLPLDNPLKPGLQPFEVKQPGLAAFQTAPWFTARAGCEGLQFRASVNGVTTSGSGYPRSELREMSADGKSNASWSSSKGVHSMTVRQAITHLPDGKPHVVAGQIHDADDDVSVFRLEGSTLYVTKGDDRHHKRVTDDYVLGTVFEVKFVVEGDTIKAYYNGELQTTIDVKFSNAYFKAGAYMQANCTKVDACNTGNYGEVVIYSLAVSHQSS